MKSITFKKKLLLNKKTIADIGNKKMNDVYGGGPNGAYLGTYKPECMPITGFPNHTNCITCTGMFYCEVC